MTFTDPLAKQASLISGHRSVFYKTPEQLDEMFQKAGYYKQRNPGYNIPKADKFTGKDGNEYFVLNLTVGVEDEPALIDGGWIESWDVLNEYNQSGKKM